MDDKEIILEKLRQGLRNPCLAEDHEEITNLSVDTIDPIDLSGLTSGQGLTWDSAYNTISINGSSPNTIWTTTGLGTTTSGSWILDDTTLTAPTSGKISLQGEDADIEINGRSLTQILDGIEQRLGMIKCREDLEKDWHDLKELGDRYREKVKHIEEKVKIWDSLKR